MRQIGQKNEFFFEDTLSLRSPRENNKHYHPKIDQSLLQPTKQIFIGFSTHTKKADSQKCSETLEHLTSLVWIKL